MLGEVPVAVAYIWISLRVGADHSVNSVIGTDPVSLMALEKSESQKTHASADVFRVHVVGVLIHDGLSE